MGAGPLFKVRDDTVLAPLPAEHSYSCTEHESGTLYRGEYLVEGERARRGGPTPRAPRVIEGSGVMSTIVGDIYAGDWSAGVKHGEGVECYHASGDRYGGDFRTGKKHGQGEYAWGDGGERYVGGLEGDLPHGSGTHTFASGASFQGVWVEGARHGVGTYTFVSGAVETGPWVDGVEQGTFAWCNGARGREAVYEEREYEAGTCTRRVVTKKPKKKKKKKKKKTVVADDGAQEALGDLDGELLDDSDGEADEDLE